VRRPFPADRYQQHYAAEVAEHLRQVAGFRGARLLRHQDGDEVMFTSIVFFTGMDEVREIGCAAGALSPIIEA
jgi:hypothetical protein